MIFRDTTGVLWLNIVIGAVDTIEGVLQEQFKTISRITKKHHDKREVQS